MAEPTADALEAAIRENPDDLAAWSAYADYLIERDDPRGEFMRVQLALEEPGLPTARRRRLQKQEDDLLDEYGRELVGEEVFEAIGEEQSLTRQREFVFRRGVLAELREIDLNEWRVKVLARTPELRWLRSLHVGGGGRLDLTPLEDAPFTPYLSALRMGERVRVKAGLGRLLAAAGRLSRLELGVRGVKLDVVLARRLPSLTELTVRNVTPAAVQAVARNPSLTGLRKLALWATWAYRLHVADVLALTRSAALRGVTDLTLAPLAEADAGCRGLIAAGWLFRLERLSLPGGELTFLGLDELDDALRERPHRLRELNLSGCRAVDADVVARFAALGIAVRADHLNDRGDPGEQPPLGDEPYTGDME